MRTVPDSEERPADVVAVSWGPWAADFAHAPAHLRPTPVAGPRQPFWRWFGPDGSVRHIEEVMSRRARIMHFGMPDHEQLPLY